ncbi:MAG TPA: Hsp20/alpha crystallin family protein [Candidatus Obscuribacterales bacterium]
MLYTRTQREYQTPFAFRRQNRFFNSRLFHHHLGYESVTPWNWQNVGYRTPETDILELDEQYLLEIALPGVVLDDVELKVEENILTLIAKRTPAMFEEKAAVLRKELPCYLIREFVFENEILEEQIEARLDRGILFVSVPKVEQAMRIPVSAGSIESHIPGMKTRVSKTESMRGGKEVTIK